MNSRTVLTPLEAFPSPRAASYWGLWMAGDLPSWVLCSPGPGLALVSLCEGLLDCSSLFVWSVLKDGIFSAFTQSYCESLDAFA